MVRLSRNLLLATCLVLVGALAGPAQAAVDMSIKIDGVMSGPRGEHDGPPPMLVLMPPPDVDKPEGMEMSDDPEEAFHQMFRAFFGMMDLDGNGELSADELSGWVHPAQHMDGMDGGPGMPGGEGMHKPPPMDGDMGEHVRRLERELRRVHHEQQMRHIEEMTHHRDRLREEHAHMLEEQQRMAEHMREMEEEARRVNEELERANSEPPISREPPMGDEN